MNTQRIARAVSVVRNARSFAELSQLLQLLDFPANEAPVAQAIEQRRSELWLAVFASS